MANNYTEFAVYLPAVDPGKLAEFIEAAEAAEEEDDEYEDAMLVGFSYACHGGELAITAPEAEGDPDKAAGFIQAFLKHFDLNGGVYFSYASTCSKARHNEFYGGGVVVTKDAMFLTSSWDALEKARAAGVEDIAE